MHLQHARTEQTRTSTGITFFLLAIVFLMAGCSTITLTIKPDDAKAKQLAAKPAPVLPLPDPDVQKSCQGFCGAYHQSCSRGDTKECLRGAACDCRCYLAKSSPEPAVRAAWEACARDNIGRAEEVISR